METCIWDIFQISFMYFLFSLTKLLLDQAQGGVAYCFIYTLCLWGGVRDTRFSVFVMYSLFLFS